MLLQWDIDAWEDYIYWQTQDKKTLRKINALIKDICRNPYTGQGKPEPLKGNLSGFYSRHIDEKDRIVYAVDEDKISLYLAEHITTINKLKREVLRTSLFSVSLYLDYTLVVWGRANHILLCVLFHMKQIYIIIVENCFKRRKRCAII